MNKYITLIAWIGIIIFVIFVIAAVFMAIKHNNYQLLTLLGYGLFSLVVKWTIYKVYGW